MIERRTFLYLMSCLLLALSCTAKRPAKKPFVGTAPKKTHEFRQGLWIRAASIASPEAITPLVQMVTVMNITDLFVQVVVGGYAYHDSNLLPRSQYLAEVSGVGYDPLDSLIRTFARTGVRVHAWVNTFLYWSLTSPPDSLNHVYHTHPDWFIRDVNGVSMADYSYVDWKNLRLEGLYLDPQNSRVTDFIKQICNEIVSKYPVDGIHLDFIRYPGILWGLPDNDEAALLAGASSRIARWCNLTRYSRLGLFERWQIWHAWRLTRNRQWAIAHLIDDVSHQISKNALKADCQLSVALFANPALFRYSFAQDWPEWRSEAYVPVIMSYTPDITLFNDYLDFALLNRPDALMGIGLLWPDIQETAKWQVARVKEAGGAGVCLFDFANIDSMVDQATWPTDIDQERILDVDSTRYEPLSEAFANTPNPAMVDAGYHHTPWGSDLRFAAFLFSLSLNPERDLKRMGTDREEFLNTIAQDVAAFRFLDREVFPLGNEITEPPRRKVRYTLIPWSAGDSLELIAAAETLDSLERDTILYPTACKPLAHAAFNAELASREILLLPAGICVFEVDTIYPGGRLFNRADLPKELVSVFVNWTIEEKAHTVLGRFN
jgi:uncharacterized lipoprotein YddW (UPF0748 family)